MSWLVKHEKCDKRSESGLPEFLVEADFIFWIWIFLFRGRTYQLLPKNAERWSKIFYIFLILFSNFQFSVFVCVFFVFLYFWFFKLVLWLMESSGPIGPTGPNGLMGPIGPDGPAGAHSLAHAGTHARAMVGALLSGGGWVRTSTLTMILCGCNMIWHGFMRFYIDFTWFYMFIIRFYMVFVWFAWLYIILYCFCMTLYVLIDF